MTAPLKKVLLADDEHLILSVLSRALGDLPITVQTCSDAPDIEKALATASFDLLITDINLNGDCGVAVARRARSVRPELPVIFISGAEIREALPGDGPVVALQKPFAMTAFISAVRRLLVC